MQSNVEKVLEEKWIKKNQNSTDVGSIQYRFEEYRALNGEVSTPKNSLGEFSRVSVPMEEYKLPHIKEISLIDKIRVVMR